MKSETKLMDLVAYLTKKLDEPLHQKFQNDTMAIKIPKSYKAIKNSKPKESAVLILLYQNSGDIQFPLIQRSTYPGKHSGQIALPGGKKEKNESLKETALRETEEEIGIKKSQIQILGALSPYFIQVSQYHVQPFVGVHYQSQPFTTNKKEVKELIEVSIHQLQNKDNIKKKKYFFEEGESVNIPYFDLQGKMVWGATANILNEFRNLLNE